MEKHEFETVIQPKSGWFDLHLKELLRYRDLMVLFVKRNFISQYKQTVLGPAWAVIQPLLTTVVFTLVFGNIAGLAAEGVTFVEHIHFVERGYESLVQKLTDLGADIRRIED